MLYPLLVMTEKSCLCFLLTLQFKQPQFPFNLILCHVHEYQSFENKKKDKGMNPLLLSLPLGDIVKVFFSMIYHNI